MSDAPVTKDTLMTVATDLIDTLVKKNHDYGNAWQRYGMFTGLIRLNDKLLRVKTLTGGQQALVADESIKDTITDIAGYALLLLLRMKYDNADVIKSLQMSLFDTPQQRLDAIAHSTDEGCDDKSS